MEKTLLKFTNSDLTLFDASEAFLKELGIRYNRGAETSTTLNAIAPEKKIPKSAQEALNLLTATYFVGNINSKTFEKDVHFDANLQDDLTAAEDEHYKGMFVFAVDLKADVKLTRTFAATLTRAFNRVAKQQPVVLFIRQNTKLSIATCERTPYKPQWLEGEKLGKVSVLMNVDCEKPHRGHINILESMQVPANCNNFDKLYEHWKKVFSSDILTEKFYKELYSWYRWAVDKNSGITFPNKVSTIEDDRDNINVKIIRLITRLLFVWFIKEKKLVPTDLFDVEKLNNILVDFDSKSGSDGKYYNAILQNLFFATLNNPIELRDFVQAEEYKGRSKEYGVKTLLRDDKKQSWFKVTHSEVISKYFHRIPNMNCGLFECLDKYSKCDIDTPEDMFLDGFSTKGTIKDGHYDRRAFIPNIFFFADDNTEVTISKEEKQNETETIKVSGLIQILDKYKFTVEENTPSDAQVSLDPELLGKVFENLLASFNPETQTTARKASGSYYTPRPIVEYMVNESLVEYLKTKVGADKEDSWRKLIGYDDAPCELNEEDRKQVLESLLNCKVLDPACGSGAFPMGMLQQMVHIINKIDKDNKLWEEIVIAHTEKEMAQAIRKEDEKERNERIDDIKKTFNEFKASPDYTRKLYIIENCIFGSDIQPIAMLISKLRFFISLICEQKDEQIHIDEEHVACNYGINTLPNLETKFVAANSLLKAKIRDCEEDWTIDPNLIQLKNDLLEIRHRHFLAKTQKEKLTLRKADEKKREEIEKYILKTTAQPNQILIQQLEAQIKLLEKDKKLHQGEKIVEELIDVQASLFDEVKQEKKLVNINERKRKEIDSQIKKCKQAIQKEQNKANQEDFANAVSQITKWNPYSQLEFAPFFDPDWMFGIKDGFDIVIGNPPYVEAKKLKYIASVLKQTYSIYSGTADLSIYFVELGYNLLANNGILTYITTNKFFYTGYGRPLRKLILSNEVNEIINFEQVEVFENVLVSSVILAMRIAETIKEEFVYERFFKLSSVQFKEQFVSRVGSFGKYPIAMLDENEWSFSDVANLKVKKSIEKNHQVLGNVRGVSIHRGVTTGCNPAFFISNAQKNELISLDTRNAAIIKNMLQGRNIRKWYYEESDENLIFTIQGINIGDYPLIESYLKRFYTDLKPRSQDETEGGRKPGSYKWYEIQDNTAYYQEFEKDKKIIWGLTADKWAYTIDTKGHYLPSNGYILTSTEIPINYILGLLNSKLLQYYFGFIGVMTAGGAYTLKDTTISALPFADTSDYGQIITLVDCILAAKQKNPHTDTSTDENLIDILVYLLYGLTYSEVKIIDPDIEKIISEEDYNKRLESNE